MVSLGIVAALMIFGAFLLWGAVIFVTWLRVRPKELPSQASSHHESNIGRNMLGGPPPW